MEGTFLSTSFYHMLVHPDQLIGSLEPRDDTSIAKEAGVEHVELVYEPQCAAAYYTHKVQGHLPKQIAVGDILLIADVGGGTGDFVSYEACEDSAQGASIGLALIDAKGD